MRSILRLTASILLLTISTTSQAITLIELPQENEEKLLIKKGRELAEQTPMKELIQIHDPSRPNAVVLEKTTPGRLMFLDEQVKLQENQSEYTTIVLIIGKEKDTEKLEVRYHYQYTVWFEKRNGEWQQVRARFTKAPPFI